MSTPSKVGKSPLNIKSKISTWLVEHLLGIYSPEQTKKFCYQNQRWCITQDNGTFSLATIVPRSCYAEFRRNYPVLDKKDLTAVLQQDYPKNAIHLISAAEHNHRVVSTFVFDEAFLASLNRPQYLLPESLVLAAAAPKEQISIEVQADRSWFIYADGAKVVSQLPNALVPNAQMFRLAQGVPDEVEQFKLQQQELPDAYVQGMMRLGLTAMLPFFYLATAKHKLPDWRPFAVATTLVLFVHMAMSSWFVAWQSAERDTQIAELGPKMTELLAAQQEQQLLNGQISALHLQLANTVVVFPLWEITRHLLDAGVILHSLDQQGTQLELRGLAQKATDVLVLLQQMPEVTDAAFIAPTRRTDEKEQFHIRLTFAAEADNAKK